MIKIDSCGWGNIVIDGQKFGQVVIVKEKVKERDDKNLRKLFGTTHQIGEWEIKELLSENPEIIIIGTGQAGVLRVDEETREKLERSKAEVKILLTQEAVSEFNRLVSRGKRVNALIHTTC